MVNEEIKETKKLLNNVGTQLRLLADKFGDLTASMTILDDDIALNDNKLKILEEIVEQAENSDYGIKTWRKLETKQDLINAIKKEVLNGK